jgi:hypothetical protein
MFFPICYNGINNAMEEINMSDTITISKELFVKMFALLRTMPLAEDLIKNQIPAELGEKAMRAFTVKPYKVKISWSPALDPDKVAAIAEEYDIKSWSYFSDLYEEVAGEEVEWRSQENYENISLQELIMKQEFHAQHGAGIVEGAISASISIYDDQDKLVYEKDDFNELLLREVWDDYRRKYPK